MSAGDAMTPALIFDVGKVLVGWDMRILFARLVSDPAEVDRILAEVVTEEWHFQSDAGRDLAEMVAERQALFPADAAIITAYAERFVETIPGPIEGMPELLAELDAAGVPLFAITNFGAEFWARFRPTEPMLDRFRDILVSGVEKLTKPDPAIYRLALDRFGLVAEDALFIDDRVDNVAGAMSVGIDGHVFTGAAECRRWLRGRGLPV